MRGFYPNELTRDSVLLDQPIALQSQYEVEHHRELVQGQHNDEVFRHNRQQGKPNLIQVLKGTIFKNQIVFPDFLQNPALISSSAAAAAAAAAAAVVVNHATGVVEAGGSWINEGKRLLL